MKRKVPLDAPLQEPMEPHLDLVERVALRYRGATQASHLDLDDLRQAGRMGLWRACQLKDRSQGFRTYAVLRITSAIRKTLEKECVAAPRPYRGAKGEPSNLGSNRSIQEPIRGDAGLTLEGTLASDDPDPSQLLEECQQTRDLESALEELPDPRTQLVIRNTLSGITVADSGRELGISRERARQLQEGGVGKIQKAIRKRRLG